MRGPFVATVRDGALTELVAARRGSRGGWRRAHLENAPEIRAYDEALSQDRSWLRSGSHEHAWEFGGGVGLGVGARGEVFAAADLRAGVRRRLFRSHLGRYVFGGPAAVEGLVGDTAGLDLRLRWFAHANEQGTFGFGTTLGVAPIFLNALGRSRVRVPSLLGLVLPEFGVMFRTASSPRPYAAFSLPVAWIVRNEVFLDVRATALVFEREGPVGGAAAWFTVAFGMGLF